MKKLQLIFADTNGTKEHEDLQDWESIEFELYDLPDGMLSNPNTNIC